MRVGASGISKYMEIILKSQFQNAHLLTADEFVKNLEEMEIQLSKEHLEFYDEKGLLRPALRYRKPILKDPNVIYFVNGPIIMEMQQNNDMVELPKDNDYRPWSEYSSEREKTVQYYHPFQFIQAHILDGRLNTVLGPKKLEELSEITKEKLEKWKKSLAQNIESLQSAMVDAWIPRVGLLMLLEAPYSMDIGRSISSRIDDQDYFNRYAKWRMSGFVPKSILDVGGFTIEHVKEVYGTMANRADYEDPLRQWYVLIELLKTSQRKALRGKALLAQNYYELAKMLQVFARNLGIELLDPDDYCDGDKGSWKPIVYGEPFDYRSTKTQMRIRDRFFNDRPYRIVIIVEGPSEEKAITMIFRALYIDERGDGILLYNARGQGNMEANLDALFQVVKTSDIEVFEIVDGEKNSKEMLARHEARGIIKSGMSKVWEKDFEYDNFGTKRVVEKVAELLQGKVDGATLTVEEVEEKMKNGSVLMNAISAITNSKYGLKVEYIVKKPELTEMLIRDRVEKIREERNAGEWKPDLEIEKVLGKIFKMIPTNL